ncbi:TraB/GumN family protein [Massilia sp. CF038]|uniref:TraB/GumN family protein n=1 Tax=Massilia sp. CF038 TaxID=1881045 RepID=UPI00091875A9|nr:TraB/GumN family protein [Massilia sp. CF038]SHH70273.1 Uncharacterized conserved protein YbaP, TraB family [Massilia sp. CF038]
MLWTVPNSSLTILGSVHVSNIPLTLSEAAQRSIDAANVFAFEANFDAALELAFTRYPAGAQLRGNINEDLYDDAKSLWTRLDCSEDDFDGHFPWWIAFVLMNKLSSQRGFTSTNGIDRKVLEIAKQKKKSLFFLESLSAGLMPFANAPVREQEFFLARIAQHTDECLAEIEALVGAWQCSDLRAFARLSTKSIGLMPKSYGAALGGRNYAWRKGLLRLARSNKKSIVIVGALHMVGVDSVPQLLAKEGYECIYAGD